MTTTWDIDLSRRLEQGRSHFELKVAFATEARRLVLFGPSGAGKTQTLKLMAGLARADRGHVFIGGQCLYDHAAGIDLPPQQRRLGFVFQDYALFPHLTVRQNIAFARRRGWFNPGRALRDEAVDHWIERFRLQPVAGHLPHQLSGGQRQRTALARALLNEPRALLLDEPFAALDRPLRERLRGELVELQQRLALPLLVITHDEDDVRALADEVIPLNAGRVGTATADTPPLSEETP